METNDQAAIKELLVPDAAINVMELRHPPIFEDMPAGIISFQRLSKLQFNTAAFMQGKSLNGVAIKRFLDKWSR